MNINKLFSTYPRMRKELPEEYKKIYHQHYKENREGEDKGFSFFPKT